MKSATLAVGIMLGHLGWLPLASWGDSPDSQWESAKSNGPVTFNRDIAPIVYTKCMSCHRDGEVAPFPLTNYGEVRGRARQIAMVVERRIMPPWKPSPSTTKDEHPDDFRFDRSLSEDQIAMFRRWIEDGRLEGRGEDLPQAPEFPSGWVLGEPDIILELPEPFEIHAEGQDIYVHFVFPLSFRSAKYLRGIQVRPTNMAVAHHGVIMLDSSGEARKQAEAHGGSHYFNFGDPGFVPRGFLPGFAPGQGVHETLDISGDGVGLTLQPGQDLVLQMHYHPTGRVEHDRPRIGLYFTDTKPKRHPAIIAMANNDIDIAAGRAYFSRTDTFTLPTDFKVTSIWAHMHLIGKSVLVNATLPDGTTRRLLHIDDWDFNWQDTYHYRDPFVLPAGTEVRAVWTWDNSAANPRNPNVPPRRITWGRQSDDEMSGLIIGGLTVKPGWSEARHWLAVIGHYLQMEKQKDRAVRRRQRAEP